MVLNVATANGSGVGGVSQHLGDCVQIQTMPDFEVKPLPHMGDSYHRANVELKGNKFIPISSDSGQEEVGWT